MGKKETYVKVFFKNLQYYNPQGSEICVINRQQTNEIQTKLHLMVDQQTREQVIPAEEVTKSCIKLSMQAGFSDVLSKSYRALR